MKHQKEKGIYPLFILMIIVSMLLAIASIAIIYKLVYNEKRNLLKELCVNQKEIIQSIYKETNDVKAVLNVLLEQRDITNGLGTTGEFAMGYLMNDSIVFTIRSRQKIQTKYLPVSLNSNLAAPLKFALLKNNGFIQGLDYKGTEVLSYCSYIPELKWGIVAKMDIGEVRLSFYKAGIYTIMSSLILIFIAIILFRKISRPISKRINDSEENYNSLFEYSAISIWKEDFSKIKKHFDKLRNSGVTDFRSYFKMNKEEVSYLASLIEVVEINQKSIEFFGIENKDDVIKKMLFYFNEASLDVFREELIVLAEGGNRFDCEMPIQTISGSIKILNMHLSVVKGFEETLSSVLVSFIDITERKKNEENLIRSRKEWMETFDLIPDMITILDTQHRIIRANKAAIIKLGNSPQNIVGSHCYQCTHGKQESPSFCPHTMMLQDGKEHIADFYEEKLGLDLLISVTPIYDENNIITGSIHIARDISELKKKEKELHQLNRTLSALSKSSQEMTHAKDESDYLANVCQIIINNCGYSMVWIGFAEENEEKNVKPVAFSGFEEGYLETLKITWADNERGNGPTGTAIRTGKPAICKNILTDPAFKPWREDALKRGYASSIVLPLIMNNKTFGAISIYSKEPDAFTDDEINLLSELANDLAYGITSIKSNIAHKKDEETLRENKEQLSAVFNGVSETLMLMDIEGNIIAANKIAANRLNLGNDDIAGKNIYDILPIHFHEQRKKQIAELIQTKNPVKFLDNLGETFLEITFYPVFDTHGNVTQFISSALDVTERKLAVELLANSEIRYRSLFESAKDGILILDAESGMIVDANPFLIELLGYTKEQFIKKEIWEIGFLKDIIANKNKFSELQQNEYVRYENLPLKTADGAVINVEFVSNVYFVNQQKVIQCNIRDITERKIFEKKLEEKNTKLAEVNASKEKFYKIIAHDMKNPFISLLGTSELLYENAHKYDINKIVKLAKILNDSAKSGFDMLLNLLDWSRSQTGSMLFQPVRFNLKELIDRNNSNILEFACSKKINLHFDIDSDLYVYADKDMLNSILRNLINNALKFTAQGGEVTVSTKNENGSVIIFIKDTGVGIEKNDFDKLFRTDIKFSQPGTEHEGGTGLGLLLCKEFIEKHDGRIWVESEIKKGSTFYFSLGDKS